MKMIDKFFEKASKPGNILLGESDTAKGNNPHIFKSVSGATWEFKNRPWQKDYYADSGTAICGRTVRNLRLEITYDRYLLDPEVQEEYEYANCRKICRHCLQKLRANSLLNIEIDKVKP